MNALSCCMPQLAHAGLPRTSMHHQVHCILQPVNQLQHLVLQAGSYCPSALQQLTCPSGSFCPQQSSAPQPCSWATHCPAGATTPRLSWGAFVGLLILLAAGWLAWETLHRLLRRRQRALLQQARAAASEERRADMLAALRGSRCAPMLTSVACLANTDLASQEPMWGGRRASGI